MVLRATCGELARHVSSYHYCRSLQVNGKKPAHTPKHRRLLGHLATSPSEQSMTHKGNGESPRKVPWRQGCLQHSTLETKASGREAGHGLEITEWRTRLGGLPVSRGSGGSELWLICGRVLAPEGMALRPVVLGRDDKMTVGS